MTCESKTGKSHGVLSFYWRCVLFAVCPLWGTIDTLTCLLGMIVAILNWLDLPWITIAFAERLQDLGAWQIPIVSAALLGAVRILLAPYYVYQEAEIEKARVVAESETLRRQLEQAPLSPVERRATLQGFADRGDALIERWKVGGAGGVQEETKRWTEEVDRFVGKYFGITEYDEFKAQILNWEDSFSVFYDFPESVHGSDSLRPLVQALYADTTAIKKLITSASTLP